MIGMRSPNLAGYIDVQVQELVTRDLGGSNAGIVFPCYIYM